MPKMSEQPAHVCKWLPCDLLSPEISHLIRSFEQLQRMLNVQRLLEMLSRQHTKRDGIL